MSYKWNYRNTMGVTLLTARMQPYTGPYMSDILAELAQSQDKRFPYWRYGVGAFPVQSGGGPVDSYSPNFYQGDTMSQGTLYSAHFNVYDLTGDTVFGYRPGLERNLSSWPFFMYTPVPEHSRPRWDLGNTVIEAVTGEIMDLRHIWPVDAWVPVIGLNAHGDPSAQPSEINIILTDIGGDPFGPPGNGGFNPNVALEVVTTKSQGSVDVAVQSDYSFNGVWLYHDTNNNGMFDAPQPLDSSGSSYGVTFQGRDYPMYPSFYDQGGQVNYTIPWEYEPFPPGGGDPWWKIRIKFRGGRRRNAGETPTGYLEPVADYYPEGTATTTFGREMPDYFIVLRTNSGRKDLSGRTTGPGAIFGGDFRAFIEPRRWNPRDGGHWDGGIWFSNMNVDRNKKYVQDTEWIDPQYPPGSTSDLTRRINRPWWHEREHTQDNVKPQRIGLEIHDLVLTYSTDNTFGRESYIHPSQPVPISRHIVNIVNYAFYDLGGIRGVTNLSLWSDPPISLGLGLDVFGIFNQRFLLGLAPPIDLILDPNQNSLFNYPERHLFNPGFFPDASELVFWTGGNIPNLDELTSFQFAFETVPFEPTFDDPLLIRSLVPRSTAYPKPFIQPTLPDYATWPIRLNLINFGSKCIVYADEASLADNVEYYHFDPNEDPNIIETWQEAWNTYKNDVYYAELLDGNFGGIDLSGWWFIDNNGGRFYIRRNNGNVLELENGHSAYVAPYLISGGVLQVSQYPYGIRGGRNNAVERGPWLVTQNAMVRNRYPQMADWPSGWGVNTAVAGPNGESRSARILRQKVEYKSRPVAMLGLNLSGADDPVVNKTGPVTLNSVTIAFWGPEFEPSDLAPLDSTGGTLPSSGVLLYEDTNNDGVFTGPIFFDTVPLPVFIDRIVPVVPGSLEWGTNPEAVDLDGDNIPDDLSGDGIVTDGNLDLSNPDRPTLSADQRRRWDGLKDLAWVLKLIPATPWVVPQSDVRSGGPLPPSAKSYDKESSSDSKMPLPEELLKDYKSLEKSAISAVESLLIDVNVPEGFQDGVGYYVPVAKEYQKALVSGGHRGDDLFVVVRTSDTVSAFEEFRCFVPARLPDRAPTTAQFAGVVLSHGGLTSRGSAWKTNPEEGGLQDFYGHDMLQVSVPARIVDLTDALLPPPTSGIKLPVIVPGGQPIAILGIDASTNRVANLIAYGNGTGATSSDRAFTPEAKDILIPSTSNLDYYVNGRWSNKVIGLWLVAYGNVQREVDKRVEAFEITGTNGRTLNLRAGTPKSGSPWYIVKDPTFLEQVIVEFYNSNTQNVRSFDPYNDLLPLNEEDPANGKVSGVSIWRDNDWDSRNTNGVFDPPIIKEDGSIEYIDLPLRLDAVPVWYSRPGDPRYQVRLVFSSPGTDNSIGRDATQGGTPYISQPRNRQPIPVCFGDCPSENAYGPDFFIVIRTSQSISPGDAFQAAIVSFGPDTPTEPDPDNFVRIYPATGDLIDGLFSLYTEFPWGNRGLGFITFFKDSQVYRYWAYDDRLRKWTARAEPDMSQEKEDRLGLKWIRSNPVTSGRTKTIVALQVPTVDFVSDKQRQVPGGQVKFTLIPGQGISVSRVSWNFGDGSTSSDRNPTHVYTGPGKYTVSVEITDVNGLKASKIKRDYIEILSAPFVSFTANPTSGYMTPDNLGEEAPGLDVQFTDQSVGTDIWKAVAWSWNFGDNVPATESNLQNPVHRYTKEGFYSVTLEVTFRNVNTNETMKLCHQVPNFITVGPCIGCPSTEGEGTGEGSQEGEGQEEASATFTAQIAIKDKEGLLPLTDWVPLFNFVMGYDSEDPAPRVLKTLIYRIRADRRSAESLGYGNQSGPAITDLLEFGLFKENYSRVDEENNYQLDSGDTLLFKWNSDGLPLGQVLSNNPFSPEGITYRLNFIGNGTPAQPQFPVFAGPSRDNDFEGNSYVVAVRTSATWRSQLTLACDVLGAEMVKLNGVFPRNADGDPVDEYDPNFYDKEEPGKLISDVGYSSSFTVWDLNGIISPEDWNNVGFDAWNYPTMLYTPLAEHTRPNWARFDQLLYMYAGELLSFRRLVNLDTWRPVIGINVHSTKSVHADTYDPLISGSRVIAPKQKRPQLREISLVVTDIGADPYGPPGNGGFDPREALDKVSTQINGYLIGSDRIVLQDIVFNGIWVWDDTNNNGKFDPPTPLANGRGVQLNGDYPLLPETILGVNFSEGFVLPTGQIINWEYIPFPPGGGDPWWKITLRFFGGRRRLPNLNNEDDVEGFVEPIPDNFVNEPTGSEYSMDYFVVIRTDSGFKDVSQTVADGVGVMMGADFRVFVEPRRVDVNGKTTGGIYVDSQIPPLGGTYEGGPPWQSDIRWGSEEPWWPQRTVNEKSTKPMKVGVDVHDLVLVYTSDSPYKWESDIFFGGGSVNLANCLGYANGIVDYPKDFDKWMDPEGKTRSKFLNRHSVGVTRWREFGAFVYSFTDTAQVTAAYDYTHSRGQYAYETVPFDHLSILGPDTRSSAYPNPLDQPTLPDYTTWSKSLAPNEYPRASQWAPEFNRARLLTQKTDINSEHTAVLGINLVGSNDPVVNSESQEPPSVAKIVVAFWGPDFTPEIFKPLDPNGSRYDSGILLWEDADKNAIFFEPRLLSTYWDLPLSSFGDKIVPLSGLSWGSAPEPIDIDGDGLPDDMDGNGVIDQRDYAWVVVLYPKQRWSLPTDDFLPLMIGIGEFPVECGNIDFSNVLFDKSLGDREKKGDNEQKSENSIDSLSKQVAPDEKGGNNPGDDLFITVSLSEKAKRFQSFRAVIPATLPGRPDPERKAGIQFYPQINTSSTAYLKSSPEEDPVQDFYGHDMLEVNVPVQIYDFTNQQQSIIPGGPPVAVMGFDISTNRSEDSVYSGSSGTGSEKTFTISEVSLPPNALVGDYLIDSAYEAYEIVGNNTNQLFLLSGTPRSGPWRIERNPTFLEEVMIEIYNEGTTLDFNPLNDFLPLNIDPEISGVALYRDNDFDPRNRNGVFDPGIDIPIQLDVPPLYVGVTGEATKVKFVFSMPGTDDVPYPKVQQPRHIQWVPTSFGDSVSSSFYGPDFFVVVRASDKMKAGTNFRIGIVNWGPNTPTEPDPDTWARLSGEQRNDFMKFREFPWSMRGLGFITYFKEPPVRYYMDGKRAGAKVDNSGVKWLRSHCTKKRRTGVLTAISRPVSPTTLVIERTSISELPAQTLPGQEVNFVIYGKNFGRNPIVKVSGYQVRVIQAEDTAISVAVSTMPGVTPTEPIVLLVRNPATGEEATRTDLLRLSSKPLGKVPFIEAVIPNKASSKEFPVTVKGNNFSPIDKIQVIFGETIMPVLAVSSDGTSISVGFPLGGISRVGVLDVTVKNIDQGTQYTLVSGFEYVNDPQRPSKKLLFGCGVGSDNSDNRGKIGNIGELVILLLLISFLTTCGKKTTCESTLQNRSSNSEKF
ncbi:MAG: PKD domain-containing protein [Candidatus Hydrogenedentes bacterium]|nr:PKD domain-containing protein [Candidatus Hydrogenedentota bacterium]